MTIRFQAITAIGLVALTAAGCSMFRGGDSRPPPPTPLAAQPTAPVTQTPLPPPGGVQPTTPATDTAALQPALEGVIQPTPAGAAPAASSVELTRPDVLGSWTVAAAGDSCQLTMVLTTWTGGYRASTRGCSNEALTGISAWNLEGNQVQLMNDSGATVARLYPASLTQFNGQTEGGGPISVSR